MFKIISLYIFILCVLAIAQQPKDTKITKPYSVNKSATKDQVDALKTEVTSQKTQMIVLKDLLKKEGLDGSRRPLFISFKNEMGNRYLVDSVSYKLNGEVVYQFVLDEMLASKAEDQKPKEKIETLVVPGPYTIEVSIVYRGNDTGVFSYLKDYRITREEKLKFEIQKKDQTEVLVRTFEEGNLLADFKDRPQIKISQLK